MTSSFSETYKIVGKIGEGSFSEVLKCQHRINLKQYAAKRLKKLYRHQQDVYKCPEIVAMKKVSYHPNLLHIIEMHHQPTGEVILIFDLLDMSIYDFMRTRTRAFSESRVKNYLYQLTKGLNHLHSREYFHRDIKPENILIKLAPKQCLDYYKYEIIKLGDLGSIRKSNSNPPLTEYISTRWYRSPECLLTTGYYGPKMDIWALGCVFYEMLTLKPLFPGTDELDQIHKIHEIIGTPSIRVLNKFKRHQSRNCSFNFPTRESVHFLSLLPSVSEAGRDILKQMLVYDPDTRPNVRRLVEHRYFNDLRALPSTTTIKYSSETLLLARVKLQSSDFNLTRSIVMDADQNTEKIRSTERDITQNRHKMLVAVSTDKLNNNDVANKDAKHKKIKSQSHFLQSKHDLSISSQNLINSKYGQKLLNNIEQTTNKMLKLSLLDPVDLKKKQKISSAKSNEVNKCNKYYVQDNSSIRSERKNTLHSLGGIRSFISKKISDTENFCLPSINNSNRQIHSKSLVWAKQSSKSKLSMIPEHPTLNSIVKKKPTMNLKPLNLQSHTNYFNKLSL